eukprot:9594444-Heterocapsa_arctica.AAC.1
MERRLTPSLLRKSTRSEDGWTFVVDKGEVEPGVNVVKNILVNWIRQTEGGLHPDTPKCWEDFNFQRGSVRGPVNYFRR